MKDIIEFTASIATLILFLFYFVGRIIMVFAVRKYWRDKVVFDEDCAQKYDVVDEVQIPDAVPYDGMPKAVLLSCEGIRNLKIYRAVRKKGKDGEEDVVRGEKLYERDFLNVNQAIVIEGETGICSLLYSLNMNLTIS